MSNSSESLGCSVLVVGLSLGVLGAGHALWERGCQGPRESPEARPLIQPPDIEWIVLDKTKLLREEVSRLREENETLRDEVDRLRGWVSDIDSQVQDLRFEVDD